jgi:hypothetical protein
MLRLVVAACILGLALAALYQYIDPPYHRAASPDAHRFLQRLQVPYADNDIPKYSARLEKNLDAFFKMYQATFTYGTCDVDFFYSMRGVVNRVHKNAMEILHRMPNDHDKNEQVKDAVKNIIYILKVHMEDVKLRCDLPDLHPDPIGDYYYVRMLRAMDDDQ